MSSLTAAYIAQQLTIGTVTALAERGERTPRLYVSANVPGRSRPEQAIAARYGDRLRRSA